MKTKVVLLISLYLAMAGTSAIANGGNTYGLPNVVAEAIGSAVIENVEIKKMVKAYTTEIDSLRQDVNRIDAKLIELQEERESSHSNTIWVWMGALFFGLVGGMLSGRVKKSLKRRVARGTQPSMGQQQLEVSATTHCQQQTQKTVNQPNRQPTNQQYRQPEVFQYVQQQSSDDAAQNTTQPSVVQTVQHEDRTEAQEIENSPTETTIQRHQKPIAKTRIAYTNLVIPQRGMVIAYDDYLNDSSQNQQFMLEINDAEGTATYTLVPDVLSCAINHLSSIENFVDKFDFIPSARQVRVVSPGKLHHENGYWQVDTLLKIEVL
jgi:hypothetical protein